MPIIRDVVAVGKTPTNLAEEMTNKLKEYVQNPVVAVTLKEVNSSNIFLLGEVAHPCIYFYFAFHYKGVEIASEVYAELERAARDEILRSGGSLSHHHGVGKLRQPFLSRVFSPAALAWRGKLKEAIDPENLLGCGNG